LRPSRCVVRDILTRWRHEPDRWPGLRPIVIVESTREVGDPVTTERRYYVSSLPPDAAHIVHAVRAHWRIEMNLHWVLGVAFCEDPRVAFMSRTPCRTSLS